MSEDDVTDGEMELVWVDAIAWSNPLESEFVVAEVMGGMETGTKNNDILMENNSLGTPVYGVLEISTKEEAEPEEK